MRLGKYMGYGMLEAHFTVRAVRPGSHMLRLLSHLHGVARNKTDDGSETRQ